MKICVFSAHPADSIMCCGGTLAKYVDHDHEVFDICVSDGRLLTSDYPEEEVARRRAECRKKAGRVLGFSEVRDLGYPDMGLPYNDEIIAKITDLIREIKPDIVLTNWWQNIHPDLRNLAMVVSDALIHASFPYKSKFPPHSVKKLYTYGPLSRLNYEPEIYIDITDYIEKKKEALSQFKLLDAFFRKVEGERSKGFLNLVLSLDRSNGFYSGVTYAEEFREHMCIETKSKALSLLPI